MSGARRYYLAFIGLVAAFALTACSEAPSQPLRVGINPWPGYAPLFLAAEKGFFAEEGVDVELIELSSLADVRRAFERGQTDGMASSLVEVLDADRNSDRAPVIALMADYSNGADVILAKKELTNVAALKGQRIGLEPSSLNRFILARALAQGGLSMDDVEIVSLPQVGLREAVEAGAVDAVVTYPPISTDIARTGLFSQMFSSADIPGEVSDVVSFDRETASRRSADLNAFVRAWGRAVESIRSNPEESYALIGRHIGMATDDLESAYQGIELITLEQQTAFLRTDGPLADGIQTLSAILWPEGEDEDSHSVGRFFRESAHASWSGVE
ncbi:MAG: ABC transporter substrate-binding protein [Rhodobiaceae bacterium]|nr:ABC transporter substrate-binding protein [Rhodobiaceae bacterium]